MSRKGWLLFITLCVIWGLPYLFIRIAVRELPPPALVFLRTAPAALLLLPFALRRGEVRRLLRSWPWVLAYTAVELCVPWLLLAHAEERISSSLAGLLIATVPLIGAVLYRAFGVADHFDARRLTGLFIGFAGVAALVGLDIAHSDVLGIVEVVLVALCYATGPLDHQPQAGRPAGDRRHHRVARGDRGAVRAGRASRPCRPRSPRRPSAPSRSWPCCARWSPSSSSSR